jgi:hypothetical protein
MLSNSQIAVAQLMWETSAELGVIQCGFLVSGIRQTFDSSLLSVAGVAQSM